MKNIFGLAATKSIKYIILIASIILIIIGSLLLTNYIGTFNDDIILGQTLKLVGGRPLPLAGGNGSTRQQLGLSLIGLGSLGTVGSLLVIFVL